MRGVHMRILMYFVFIMATASWAGAKEWYENLRPGVSRADIIRIAGEPTSSAGQTDRYDLKSAYVELKYDGDTLITCNYYEREKGGSSNFYHHFGHKLTSSQIQARKGYLKAGKYVLLPKLEGPFIRTARYHDSVCYQVDDSFLIVEPILSLMGATGFFADKAAKVMLLDSAGIETILYRAIDNWINLKPPDLSAELVEKRTGVIQSLIKEGKGITIENNIFGNPDSTMGSGILYSVFYFKDGLAIGVLEPKGTPIGWIHYPGRSHFSLDKYRN